LKPQNKNVKETERERKNSTTKEFFVFTQSDLSTVT